MKSSEIYVKLLKWGIFASLFIPLVIFSQYLSPFHFGKMIVFRILVEILLVIYIPLIIANKKYLPSPTAIILSFTIFTGIYALASFTAVDFNYAFWGTLERMGGLFSFLHFWVFFIILVGVFKKRKDWETLLKISIFVGFLSILFAYGQHFELGNFFVGWQHGERVIGTIGNPALFAGYLLFVFFLSIYFLLRKDIRIREKGFYAAVLILGLPILHITAVRGAVIAFWAALFLLGLFYLLFLKHKKIKSYIFIGLIIFLILIAFIWLNKNQPWIKNNSWLGRITNISLTEETAQTRLWAWHSGLMGFKERPILGWGPENFVLAHAKYFNSRLFTSIGSETIWDRAHNIVIEMLTTMGAFGILSYLSIFALVYYLLIKRFTPLETKKSDEAKERGASLTGFKEKRIGLVEIGVFGVMLFAYFFQNLFIFDTMANYFLFFLILGYLNFILKKNESVGEQRVQEAQKEPSLVLIFILALLAIALIYKTNIEPARAVYACTRGIIAGHDGNPQASLNYYKKALSFTSPQGKYEIRERLATFAFQYSDYLRSNGKDVNKDLMNYVISEMEKTVKSHPLDYIPYLYIGRAYILLMPVDSSAGAEAINSIMRALAINDKNPRIWYELGQTKLSLRDMNGAISAFKKALELNPDVPESNWFLGMTYAQAGNMEEALKYVEQAIKMHYNYKESSTDILRLINLYSSVGNYNKVIEFYQDAIDLQPQNAQFYASLAAAYKKIGDKENAIFYARKAGSIDPKFATESEKFIESLNNTAF